jgi:hypothetical protein
MRIICAHIYVHIHKYSFVRAYNMSACTCVLSYCWPVHHGPQLTHLLSVRPILRLSPPVSLPLSLPFSLFLSLILAANAILTLNSQEQEFEVRIS